MNINYEPYFSLVNRSYVKELGKVAKIVGLTVESVGPTCKLNDLCIITSKDGSQSVMAEVVGFRDSRVLLMPFDNVDGIGLGATVENTKEPLKVPVGEELLGRSLDGLGRPLDGKELHLNESYPIEAPPPDPLKRKMISEPLCLGVKAVDGMLMVTQYDISWREDVFDKWDFYDVSQSQEFIRAGYKVVVPSMEKPWCIHDDGFMSLDNYYEQRRKLLREYF